VGRDPLGPPLAPARDPGRPGRRSRATRTRAFIAILTALAFVPLARADGLPLADVGAPATLGSADGSRYVALQAGTRTVVARLNRVVYTTRTLPGTYTIPVVALDGSAAGLSADGRTLVLIRPRMAFRRARTSFAVLDARSLRLRDEIVLRGDFSFDALSPDGSLMYLIQYLSPTDPTKYEVRAYSLPARMLLPHSIVDKSEPDERMAGLPVSRVTSVEGRWAYTLYDGGGGVPFVHALDTKQGEARCIDLASLGGRQDIYQLRLRLGPGGRLAVVKGARELVGVDTSTFAVGPPRRPSTRAGHSFPWIGVAVLVGLGLAVAAAAGFLLVRRYRERAYQTFPGPL
jgi:hypothetical protein